MKKILIIVLLWAGLVVLLDRHIFAAPMPNSSTPASAPDFMQNPDYQEYLKFFEEVYKTMNANYYHDISPENFKKFLGMFNTKIYSKIQGGSHDKTVDFVKWRSSAFLIDALKSPDDIFSAFYPPKAAKDYETSALGKKVDLGIEGTKSTQGYLVSKVEIRSDAYEKGLRPNDVITQIDTQNVAQMTEDQLKEKMNPLEGSKVLLRFLSEEFKKEKEVQVVSKEYFKQLVWRIPVKVPGICGIELQHFNRMTGEDMTGIMRDIIDEHAKGLIIDLRGNPGGPPLAAREISAFFLPPKDEFAYFQKKNRPKAALDVPEIPENYHYSGNIVILVNNKSGSASELFAGILQRRGRAVVMGTNTAGQVFLKSMYPFSDGSMLLLVTARGHHPDGEVFSYSGVNPDVPMDDPQVDLIEYAANYLAQNVNKEKPAAPKTP